MGVSIVIPNLHSPVIAQVLEGLRAQTWYPPRFEVLVVGLDQFGLVQEDETVRFISTTTPVGPARARNIGWNQAQHDYIIFLDADCVPTSSWLSETVKFVMTHRDVGAALSGMVFDSNKFWTVCDQIAMFHEHLAHNRSEVRQSLPSYALFVPRQVLEATQGFDETFLGPAGEDLDFTIRIQRLGYRLYFNPRAVVIHRPSRQTLGALWKHGYRAGHESIRVRMRYPDVYRLPPWSRSAISWRVLSPGIALVRTAQIFQSTPGLWRYWYCAPFTVVNKLAWCWGVAASIKQVSR